MLSIPKIIHYCWVGGEPKPKSVLYCIETWKRCCPDYEIKEWNETNYNFTKNEYMRQAYEAQKWGFVPDYARLDIIYEYGGIYLDTDVEILKSFDELLNDKVFFGFEDTGDGEYFVNCGHGFGAVPKNNIIKELRDIYENLSFINSDGSLNMLASPYYTTLSLSRFGLIKNNVDQHIEDLQIYASDVLCPKNFRTGKINKTRRTVSIHHFTATWVDEKIKEEMAHQQKIKNLFGGKIGGGVLYAESVVHKYASKEHICLLPNACIKKIKSILIKAKDAIPYYLRILEAKLYKCGGEETVLLNTGLESDNMGDWIIMDNCKLQLSDCFDVENSFSVPTHRIPNEKEKKYLCTSNRKILCGTNILSGHMRRYGLWKLETDVSPYLNTILMGVGFDSTDKSYDFYTKILFKTILCKNGYHSVRDSFSKRKLNDMGIKNVLNTGCPTMWNMTPEHCSEIPCEKAMNVVCTVTDYCQDEQNDSAMLEILLESYVKVYLWLQGTNDLEYIRKLGYEKRLILIDSSLEAYDEVLRQDNIDYVGTRLHGGIRAMSKGHRSLIVSIDNRAESISNDTGLPIIKREDILLTLKERIYSSYETRINMPWDDIERWKKQFARQKDKNE